MMKPVISIIAAIGANRELGKDNDLLWRIPADWKRFKEITSGHTVIMGRKTFESINAKPLKNRRNIVITRQKGYPGNGAEVVDSWEVALQLAEPGEEVFILGGAQIYDLFLPIADRLYLTHVHRFFDEADTWFPEYNPDNWEIIEQTDIHDDEEAGLSYSYINYRRNN